VCITAAETDNIYKPDGGASLTLGSDPRKDRHIAQRNLAPYEITPQGPSRSSGRPSSSPRPAKV
jgi:hypothetical protein